MLPDLRSAFHRHRVLAVSLTVVAVLLLVWSVAPIPASAVESLYSLGLYRWIGWILVPATSLVPFSLSLVGAVGGAGVFLWFWGRNWRRLYRERGKHRHGALWGARWLAILLVFVYFAFLLIWGAGYRRVPLAERLALSGDPIPEGEMERYAKELLGALGRVLPEVRERDVDRAVISISQAMSRRINTWDGAAVAVPSRVKVLPAGALLSFGTSGVTSPLLLEAHVDGGLAAIDQVRVAAHELAHAAGYCTEAEADLAAYLAGLEAGDAFARYCVLLAVFVDIARQLQPEPRERLLDALPRAAVDDLLEAREARSRFGIRWLSKLQSLLYDSYLKSQGVEEGIRNYSTGIRHFALAWRKGLVKLR